MKAAAAHKWANRISETINSSVNPDATESVVVNSSELAKILKCHPSSIEEWVSLGILIPHDTKTGNSTFFCLGDVENQIRKHPK